MRYNSFVDGLRQTAKGKYVIIICRVDRKSAAPDLIPTLNSNKHRRSAQQPEPEINTEDHKKKFFDIPIGNGERKKFILEILKERNAHRTNRRVRHNSLKGVFRNSLTDEKRGSTDSSISLKRSSSATKLDIHKISF